MSKSRTKCSSDPRAVRDWLERHFADGEPPETLACCVLHGRRFEMLGVTVEEVSFPLSKRKLLRAERDALAGRFVAAMRHDALTQQRAVVYGIFAFGRRAGGRDSFSRLLWRCDLTGEVAA